VEDYNQFLTIPPRLNTLAREMQDSSFQQQLNQILGQFTSSPVKK